jgi:hypothetical protein
MTRILAVLGLAVALMGCVSADDGFGYGNPVYNNYGYGNPAYTGIYDAPKVSPGGVFGG